MALINSLRWLRWLLVCSHGLKWVFLFDIMIVNTYTWPWSTMPELQGLNHFKRKAGGMLEAWKWEPPSLWPSSAACALPAGSEHMLGRASHFQVTANSSLCSQQAWFEAKENSNFNFAGRQTRQLPLQPNKDYHWCFPPWHARVLLLSPPSIFLFSPSVQQISGTLSKIMALLNWVSFICVHNL